MQLGLRKVGSIGYIAYNGGTIQYLCTRSTAVHMDRQLHSSIIAPYIHLGRYARRSVRHFENVRFFVGTPPPAVPISRENRGALIIRPDPSRLVGTYRASRGADDDDDDHDHDDDNDDALNALLAVRRSFGSVRQSPSRASGSKLRLLEEAVRTRVYICIYTHYIGVLCIVVR